MRIAHVISTFPPQIGGMGSVCYDEAKRLAERGHEVTVFTLKYPEAADDKNLPFKVVRLKPLVKFGDAGLAPQILKHLKNNFDLVHLHYPFYGGAEWLCFSRIPLVITYHMDAQANGVKAVIAKIYDWFWPKILFARAKKVIGVDENYSEQFKFYNEIKDKLAIIPNGVDTETFKPAPVGVHDLGLPQLESKKIILFTGNMLPIKRFDLLLLALKRLNDPRAVVLAVGGGYDLAKYRQAAKDLGVSAQARFVGPTGDWAKLNMYYNAATCLVVPSDYESFSLAAAEAMAAGLPVVASDIPPVKSKITHGREGLLFAQGSADDLVGALKQMLSMSDDDRKAMGQRGRVKIEAGFSLKQHMEKLEKLYAEV